MLLDNRKFDMRVFVLVLSVKPLIVYYYDGYVRRSLSEYNPLSNDTKAHVTNQGHDKLNISNADEVDWPLEKL